LLAGEWLSATYTNSAAATLYKQNKLPEQKDTLLLTDSTGAVTAEATRLVALRSVPRYTYRLTCTPKFVGVALGQMITITHNRFGLASGAPAQVVSTEIDWDTGFITLEILV
jgi:hypothetical protein